MAESEIPPVIAIETPAPGGKRKRGASSPLPAESISGLVGVLSGMAAARYGPVWQLDPAECDGLGAAAAQCLRHVPIKGKQAGIAVDLIALAGVSLAVFGPRVAHVRAERLARRPAPVAAPAPRRPEPAPEHVAERHINGVEPWGLALGPRA